MASNTDNLSSPTQGLGIIEASYTIETVTPIADTKAATSSQPGVDLVNHSRTETTYVFYNNYWNGNGTAGANFDHPDKSVTLKPGARTFVPLSAGFKGRV